jgi:hypothetical protein
MLGGLLLLGNKLAGQLDYHAEVIVVLQDLFQLWDLQIDQHTSNLWCLVTLQLLDEFENYVTNLFFVEWVFFDDSLHHRNAALQVSVFVRQDWLLSQLELFYLLLGGLLLLGNKLAGQLDYHAEVNVVLQYLVQLRNLQIDQHTSDLWCLVTLQLLDKFENCVTNLFLEVWVFFDDSLHHRNAALQVSVFDRKD